MMTKLVRYDPFREMSMIRDSMLRDLSWPRLGWLDEDSEMMALDVTENEKDITVEAVLPGVKEDDIDVRIEGDMLTISAEVKQERDEDDRGWHIRERRYGKFQRCVRLPAEVRVEQTEAELENGILTVTLPKAQPGPLHKIAVKAKNLLSSGKDKGKS